jgi:ribosomal protein S18 acetylase RimI-like enzyme
LALMCVTPARLRSNGWPEVVLWMIEENHRAVGFYERLGFKRDGSEVVREMLGTHTNVVRLRLGNLD